MKKYRKIVDGRVVIRPRNKIVVVANNRQFINPSHDMLIADGWELYSPVVRELTEEELARQTSEGIVNDAKEMLNGTDYKVIKCMEAYLCGEDLPYDIHALHAERELQRKMINENEMDYVESNL